MTSKTTLFGLLLIAVTGSQAQYPSEAIGKQRAGTSRLAWEVREGLHPNLGTLKSALLKAPIETAAGGSRVYSRVTFACDKAAARLVIVLANSSAADGAAPLRPATEPLLFCNRAEAPGDTKLVREEVLATWETTKGGE